VVSDVQAGPSRATREVTIRALVVRIFTSKCVTLRARGHGRGRAPTESGDVVSEVRRDVAIGIRDAVRGGMRFGCGAAFVSLLALSACVEGRPQPPRTVTVARVPRDGEPRTYGTPTMLVWVRDKQGLAWTYQVQPDGKADTRLEGIHIATKRGQWTWVTKTLDVETEPCDLSLGSRHPAQGGTMTRASALGSGDREQVIVDPETGCGGEHCPNEVRHDARPVASLGSYLFVEQSTYAYACGAHGFTNASFVIWDLDQARAVDLVGQVPNRHSLLADAARLFAEDAADRPVFGEGKAEITELLPVVDPSSRSVGFQAQLTVPTCYACGDGLWSSYTRSVRVKTSAPPALASFSELPLQVSVFLSRHPGLALGGWSEGRAAGNGETAAE
jgi:hypothetical protein